MLKFIFWTLLSINAALLAYGQGLLGKVSGGEHEPARMKNQLNADQLVLISASAASKAALPAPTPAPAAAPGAALVPEPAPVLACVEFANVAQADARRVEALLAPLALGERQSRESVPTQEVTSHIVYIPSQGSKEGAERKANELKNLGITNYFIMNEPTAMKWGISLGVFKSEAAAQTLLAALNRQGVVSARVAGRGSQSAKLTYRLRGLDPETRARVDAIANRLPPHDTRSCKQAAKSA